MMKLDNFINMMTGHFNNKEQFDNMQREGKTYPYAEHIHLSHNHLFSTHPLRKLIFGHYISSFPLSYHTPSVITQITFLNASSKSPYKQMHGSRARSDACEQTRCIFTLPSRKRLKEQPNQPLFLMLSIYLKF